MDGRKAAFNVLIGVVVGACVPMAIALVMTESVGGFHWREHPFTILFLSLGCAVVGLVVNLPWTSDSAGRSSSRVRHRVRFDEMPPPPRPRANGTDREDHAGAPRAARADSATPDPQEQRQRRADPPNAAKRYAMSRREALRALGLEHSADDEMVRDAYRRLAKEHHPDQAAAAGPDAVADATRKFVRLREAYDVLIDEA